MRFKELFLIFYRKFKNLILLFAYSFIFLTVFFVIKSIFSVSVIEVSGIDNLKELQNLRGRIIFFIFPKDLEKKLHDANPQVRSLKITKIYPSKIQIFVEKYFTVAVFEVDKGYLYLSEDGRILEKKNKVKEPLPIIHYYQKLHSNDYNMGDKLEYKDIIDSLFFLNKLTYLGIKINNIDITGLDMLIFNSEDKKYIFTTDKEKQLQYQWLKTIIERFKIERTKYSIIDLRFDKPVLKLR